MYQGVCRSILPRITSAKTAQEAWQILENHFAGCEKTITQENKTMIENAQEDEEMEENEEENAKKFEIEEPKNDEEIEHVNMPNDNKAAEKTPVESSKAENGDQKVDSIKGSLELVSRNVKTVLRGTNRPHFVKRKGQLPVVRDFPFGCGRDVSVKNKRLSSVLEQIETSECKSIKSVLEAEASHEDVKRKCLFEEKIKPMEFVTLNPKEVKKKISN